MITYKTIGQWEKQYCFVDAVAETDVLNGDGGKIEDGKFKYAEDGTYIVMNEEVGDDMYMPEYKIPAGTHVRCLDLSAIDGQTLQIYDNPLPADAALKDKLHFDAKGKLVKNGDSKTHLEVTKIIGNKLGVEAVVKVVAGE